MIFDGQHDNAVTLLSVNDAIGFVDAVGPPSAELILQRFGLSDALKGAAKDVLDELIDALECPLSSSCQSRYWAQADSSH